MSNKFKRVAETEGIPENVKQAFFGKDEYDDEDQFKELRAGRQERRRVIAQEENTGRASGASRIPDKSWERKTFAEVYQDNKFSPEDDEMSNLNAYDVSSRGVRRASFDTDNGLSARNIHLMNETDALSLMSRESSIWDDDQEEMIARLDEAMEEHDARFGEGQATNEQRRAQLHDKWERDYVDDIHGRKYSSSRANPLVRTFNEKMSASDFGLKDSDSVYSMLRENEARRHASIDEKREQRLAIKDSRKSRRENHDDWENDRRGARAGRFQDGEGDWIEEAVSKFRNV